MKQLKNTTYYGTIEASSLASNAIHLHHYILHVVHFVVCKMNYMKGCKCIALEAREEATIVL